MCLQNNSCHTFICCQNIKKKKCLCLQSYSTSVVNGGACQCAVVLWSSSLFHSLFLRFLSLPRARSLSLSLSPKSFYYNLFHSHIPIKICFYFHFALPHCSAQEASHQDEAANDYKTGRSMHFFKSHFTHCSSYLLPSSCLCRQHPSHCSAFFLSHIDLPFSPHHFLQRHSRVCVCTAGGLRTMLRIAAPLNLKSE